MQSQSDFRNFRNFVYIMVRIKLMLSTFQQLITIFKFNPKIAISLMEEKSITFSIEHLWLILLSTF